MKLTWATHNRDLRDRRKSWKATWDTAPDFWGLIFRVYTNEAGGMTVVMEKQWAKLIHKKAWTYPKMEWNNKGLTLRVCKQKQ